MIDEPIIFASYELRKDYIEQAEPGTTLFSITDNIYCNSKVVQFVRISYKIHDNVIAAWQCWHRGYQIFESSALYGQRLSPDKFFDWIKLEYPEHFEWFLFHPEWF